MSEYELLDSGDFKKLERFADTIYCRPSPAAVWPKTSSGLWNEKDGEFLRYTDGNGEWKLKRSGNAEEFIVDFPLFRMKLTRTSFGHMGVFPEQKSNWDMLSAHTAKLIEQGVSGPKVLNLFAYTGGSTLACSLAGAKVTHVDASKTTVTWARENAELNGKENDIRWLTDDVTNFVEREVRRGSTYNGIILDPPTYGRGPKKQLWKIEEDLAPLLSNLNQLLEPEKSFVLLSAHSPGYTPAAQENLLKHFFSAKHTSFECGEMIIPAKKGCDLPSGAFAFSSNT